ncbi:MAG: Wzz/FepE/Etk N-terminal domain-containing protein [Geminicoccaceae bacterium]
MRNLTRTASGAATVRAVDQESAADVLLGFLLRLRRRWWLILLVTLATVTGAYLVLQALTDIYEAKAQLLVKLGRENLEVPVTVDKGNLLSSGVRREEINSEVQLLTSPDLLMRTVDGLGADVFAPPALPEATTALQRVRNAIKGFVREIRAAVDDLLVRMNLKPDLSEREKTIVGLKDRLNVYREGESDVIAVSLRHADPQLAVAVLRKLIDLYLEQRVLIREQKGLQDLFREQVETYQAEIDRLDLQQQKLRHDLALSSIEDERRLLLTRQTELARLLEIAKRERAMLPSTAGQPRLPRDTPKPAVDALGKRIAELEIERNRTLQAYKLTSEQVVRIDQELRQLRRMAAARLDGEISALEAEIGVIADRLTTINRGEDELIKLERDSELAKQHLISYDSRLENARITDELDQRRNNNIAILSPPTEPLEPVAPRRMFILLIALPAGLAVGVLLALLLDFLAEREPRAAAFSSEGETGERGRDHSGEFRAGLTQSRKPTLAPVDEADGDMEQPWRPQAAE